MKLNLIFVTTILCLLLDGCNQSKAPIEVVKFSEVIERMDTLSIELHGDLLDQYIHWTISDDNYFVSYNYLLHKIDVFDLSKEEFSHSVQLESGGPNEVQSFMYAVKEGDEYVLIMNGYFLYRVNGNGEVISKIPLGDATFASQNFLPWQKRSASRNFDALSIDHESESFFRPIYKYNDDEIDYDAYFMCRIDPQTWNSELIKINYPKEYIDEIRSTSFLGDGSMTRVGSSIIFNFPGLNEIFRYDTTKQKLEVYEPAISNEDELVIPDSGKRRAFRSSRYLAIKYDPINKLFYRMHKTPGGGKDQPKAKLYLIAMDSEFNTLREYELGEIFSPRYGIHGGYLYFNTEIPAEDALHYLRLFRIQG